VTTARQVWESLPDARDRAFDGRLFGFRDDYEGPVRARLLRYRPARAGPGSRAVLWLHGYADYFFHEHVAEQVAGNGYAFFALDLRRYGRSLLAHQTPNFCKDLSEYYPEIGESVRAIRAEGHERVTIFAHSLGGLIAGCWRTEADDETVGAVDSLVLNSPFLASPFAAESPARRRAMTAAVEAVARVSPYARLPRGGARIYGPSLHREAHGEWDYHEPWKPNASFPVRAGWLAAVIRGQQRLRSRLGPGVPALVLTSDRSSRLESFGPLALETDLVLDVDAIHSELTGWRPQAERVVLPGAVHDVTLSRAEVRRLAMDHVLAFLRARETG
jgi:alpha-beta hydrolase superfamily lysophospholipase